MTPKIRANRILKPMLRYIDLERDEYPSYLLADTNFIGVYENIPGSAEGAVLIKHDGIQVLNTDFPSIAFSSISRADLPTTEKMKADHILLSVYGKETPLRIPVEGGDERTRDVFEFLRFLDRCISDSSAR